MHHADVSCSVAVEFAVGKVEETIQKMIWVYRPDSIVVGTRGKESKWTSGLIGRVSKYAVTASPVPVIVVKPEIKTKHYLHKRADRQSYADIVDSEHTS